VAAFCLVMLVSSLIYRSWPDQNLHLVICDVGQGDSILITYGFVQIIVDAGPDEAGVLRCLRDHLPFWDRRIELIVPTHFDKDHIGGFSEVLRRYQVMRAVLPDDERSTAEFGQFKTALLEEQRAGMLVESVFCQSNIGLGDTVLLRFFTAQTARLLPDSEVCRGSTETQLWDKYVAISPDSAPTSLDANNRSTVISIQAGQVGFLLTGDLEASGESALLHSGLVMPMTVLKVGHHGSKSGTTTPFLQAVQPELAVISAGKNNAYGHPSAAVLERVRVAGVQTILQTDQHGTVELVSDGRHFWWTTTEPLQPDKNH
jgi:competence protein ComEC